MLTDKMKVLSMGVVFLCGIAGTAAAQQNDYPIQPVAFTQVHLTDDFWEPKIEVNASVTIPYILQKCRETGRIDNFLRASKKLSGDKLTDFPFDDTDLYKLIEGASYGLQVKKNPVLERQLDTLIGIIAAAQEPDGYLYTFRTVQAAKPHDWIGARRWEKEEELSHELYDAGHLYESAVAHYQATGKRTLLNVAIKNANLLVKDFGFGKIEEYPGHQIVEIGLVKLYRVTGEKKYLDLAKFFLDVRGPKGEPYNQADKKVTDQHEAEGHAVRAAYMYTGMADVAALTGDKNYLKAIDDIWSDVVTKKLYITGGIGSTNNGEAFGDAYELPNMSAYAETCAAIANVYWNSRMFLLHGDSKYIDVLERTMYNGLLSGISLSGDRFFYPNPLASVGQHQRSGWFSCACCISNVTRFLPSVPGYVYAQNGNELYINLFMSNQVELTLPVTKVSLIQKTDYPWAGRVAITVEPEKSSSFLLKIRIPGWAKAQPIPGNLYHFADERVTAIPILVNGKPVDYKIENGYALLQRTWKRGDNVLIDFPMPVQKVLANENIKADKERMAFQRGPLVYCLEGADQKDSTVQSIVIDTTAFLQATYNAGKLNGITELATEGVTTSRIPNSDKLVSVKENVRAIPYYSWNNRGAGEMEVWVPYTASASRPRPAPSIASRSKVSSSARSKLMTKALNDQYDPADSKDNTAPYLHWWPAKDTDEFVQYDFDSTYTISESKVYWFDDGPWGGCRIPASWKLYYKKDGAWVPVKNTTDYEIAKDKYNTVKFEPVTTTALKMEVRLPVDNASGIHEWIVIPALQAPLPAYQPTRAEIMERYRKAKVLDSLAPKSIYKAIVHPHWRQDGTGFWYKNMLKDSVPEYIYVDIAKGTREKRTVDNLPKDTVRTSHESDREWARWANFSTDSLSPDHQFVAYIKDGNVFVRPAAGGGGERFTTDGDTTHPYGELAWSPDSKYVVGYHIHPVEDSAVYYVLSSVGGTMRGQLHQHPYKQPGDPFTTYEMYLFTIASQKTVKVNTPVIDFFGSPQLHWRNKDSRYFTYEKVDRGHQRFRIIEVDAETAATRTILDEQTNTFIYESRLFTHYLPETHELLLTSEKDGWRHLYRVDAISGKEQPVTHGQWIVRDIDSVDAKKREIWFSASGMNPGEDPYYIHYYRIGFDGQHLVSLTEARANHIVSFSPDKKYYLDAWSEINVPTVTELHRTADGKKIMEVERADASAYLAAGLRLPEPFHAKGRDGVTDIWGVVCRPADFDSTKSYPVVENIYAGPQASFVPKDFTSRYGEMQSIAQLGFIVVQIDGMGTANRSKAFHDVCWKNLADAGFPDRILWIKALSAKYPYVDTSRVGLYGTSAGGQNSLGGLLFHSEFYKAAVSSCGCHDNRIDKQWWNEQWMGYPVGKHYDEQSNVTNAWKLHGDLLLMVGEGDNNVPPESTYRVADALIKAGKVFEFLPLPGMDHTDGGPYGRIKRRDFFVKHLLGVDPPQRNL